MNLPLLRRPARWLLLVLLLAFGGCAGMGGGYYDEEDGFENMDAVDYPMGFYEPYGFGNFYAPYGYYYGGWQPGYRVGPPPPGGYSRPAQAVPSVRTRPFARFAPAGRPIPSIPMRSRGGHWGGDGQRR
ncbi:hypothetical protein MIZ01_1323 [Sideroxyarcus emersonii]|uniref:Lipoprotein n=1 Tax=Sideroxyarcus emersonii TaxID=2764705 RepID=A0AAN1XAF4_9PROT|nr:hypothetical protein [Sideroxyarcus emersonii]BCK87539.1 hypothetical protein MIZ01_1323 [Sideroxyarcus emersonii]